MGGGGGGTTCIYMYKQHSIVITGNFNADFELLTHNRYSVLNGHFVRQIHPSSFEVKSQNIKYTHSRQIEYKHGSPMPSMTSGAGTFKDIVEMSTKF